MGHLLNNMMTIAVLVLFFVPIVAIRKGFQKSKSSETTSRMPSFGGGSPGGWVERKMSPRSAAGKPAGARPSFGGSDQPAERSEPKPFGGGYQAPPRSAARTDRVEEVHYEGYERAADWEARKQRYAEQDRVHMEGEKRQTDLERAHLDQLRQGIIWSEILGLPRAKRPYGK